MFAFEVFKPKHDQQSVTDAMVNWRMQLAGTGIESDTLFPEYTSQDMRRYLLHENRPSQLDNVMQGLSWNDEAVRRMRVNIARAHETADKFYIDKQYIPFRTVAKEEGRKIRESAVAHGVRASYFALAHMGIADPLVHLAIRMHDYANYHRNTEGAINEQAARETIVRTVTREYKISSQEADEFASMLYEIRQDDERCRSVANQAQEAGLFQAVGENQDYTPETFWDMYKTLTTDYTDRGTVREDIPQFRSPATLYESAAGRSGGGVELNQYRKSIVRLALAYEKYRNPKTKHTTQDKRREALMVLTELWPVARGLDESIMSRYAGECIAMSFMPKAYGNLRAAVMSKYGELKKFNADRAAVADWFKSNVEPVIAGRGNIHLLTDTEFARKGYDALKRDNPTLSYGPNDMYIPGVTRDAKGGIIINTERLIDVKTRSSVFWKMLELWNDRRPDGTGKYDGLPDEAKALRWGSTEFWQWALDHHHDIFRTQVIFLGNAVQHLGYAYANQLKAQVLDSSQNHAQVIRGSRPDAVWLSEVFEEKLERGVVNAIFRPPGCGANIEVQVKGQDAFLTDTIQTRPYGHEAYKMRHAVAWWCSNHNRDIDETRISLVADAHRLRRAQLAFTYGFEDTPNPPQHGGIFSLKKKGGQRK